MSTSKLRYFDVEHQDPGLLNLIQLDKALRLVDTSVPESVEQELLKLYEAVTTATKGKYDEFSSSSSSLSPLTLSESTLQFLSQNFRYRPALVHWIIDQLLCIWSPLFEVTDFALQDLYVDVLREIIQDLSPSSSSRSTILTLCDQQPGQLLSALLCILSVFDIIESKEKLLVTWLWPSLHTLEVCRNEDVALALFARTDAKCFKLWNEFLDNKNSRDKCTVDDNLENALSISSAILQSVRNEPEEISELCLNVFEVFTRVLRYKNHWLNDLLDICYTLTINDRLDQVSKILENPHFHSLWLPLLFKCLANICCFTSNTSLRHQVNKKCASVTSSSLKYILDHCHLNSMNDAVTTRLESSLLSHLGVCNWIIKSTKNSLNIELDDLSNINANVHPGKVFHHLQENSILSTIKLLMPNLIHYTLFEEIFTLLKNSSESSMTITYQAYVAMLCALKALLGCASYNKEFEGVHEHFGNMERHVNTLYPLDLRLEVLENIFSMMFLRHEHFHSQKDDDVPCCNSDDNEDDVKTARTEKQSIMKRRSTSSHNHMGFICSKYAIREKLHYLRRCLFVLMDNVNDVDNVDCGPLQIRISVLDSYIKEATWILKLVTSPEFLQKQGVPDDADKNDIFNGNKSNFFSFWHHRSNFNHFYGVAGYTYSSDDEADDLRKPNVDTSKSENSYINTRNVESRKKKGRRRIKSLSLPSSSSQVDSTNGKVPRQIKKFPLVNYMLASKETLVVKCMWKDDYTQAEQLIKAFNMDDHYLTGEIRLSQAIRVFKYQELVKQYTSEASNISHNSNRNIKKNKKINKNAKRSLALVRKVAEYSLQGMRTMSLVETFLISQKPNLTLMIDEFARFTLKSTGFLQWDYDKKYNDDSVKEVLNALVAIDLALTMGINEEISENLGEIAKEYFSSCNTSILDMKFHYVFNTIFRLFLHTSYHKSSSLHKIICDARIPLSFEKYSDDIEHWKTFYATLSIIQPQTKCIDALEIGDNTESDDNNTGNQLENTLMSLFEDSNEKVYLRRLIAHLNLIRIIAPSPEALNSSASTTIAQQIKPYLLKNSIDSYVGYQIFDLNITELEPLEIIASQLQINLVYYILSTCCPKLLCGDVSVKKIQENNMPGSNDDTDTCQFTTEKKNFNKWGIIILNKYENDGNEEIHTNVHDSPLNDPNQLVIEILSELTGLLQQSGDADCIPTETSDLTSLLTKIKPQNLLDKILRKTSCLINCDLSHLSFGNQTQAFFLNVWNLMIIHSMLKVWTHQLQPLSAASHDLRHAISCSTIGYLIGDLGFVTLRSLRSKLLGTQSLLCCVDNYKSLDFQEPLLLLFFPEELELNELAWQDLDLQQDPRVIFAMINEYEKSPVMKIYYSETLNDDLKGAVDQYLNFYCSNQSDEFRYPKLIEKYRELLASVSFNVDEMIQNLNIYCNENQDVQYESFEYFYDVKWKYPDNIIKMKRKVRFAKLDDSEDDDNDISTACEKSDEEKKNLLWTNRIIRNKSNTLQQYLEGHSWLLSYLVQRIHGKNPTILHDNCLCHNCLNFDRVAILENLFTSPWADDLKYLFHSNSTVAALTNYNTSTVPATKLWHYFDIFIKNCQFIECLTILNSLPDTLLIADAELQCFRDKILTCLIINNYSSDNIYDDSNDNYNQLKMSNNNTEILQYLYQIKDIYVLTQVILLKVKTWPVNICEEALRHVLNHVDFHLLPVHCRTKINEILCRVLVFNKIQTFCKLKNGNDICEADVLNDYWYNNVDLNRTEQTDPTKIVRTLIDANQYELCLEWMQYQTPSSEIQSLVFSQQDLFLGLLKNEKDNFYYARKLLSALPIGLFCVKLCKGVLDKLKSTSALKFVIEYLLNNSSALLEAERDKYQKSLLGIDIIDQLDIRDRLLYIHLISEPLLILEQLLMNSKFDNLQKILKNNSEQFKFANFTIEDFDKIVRFYAQKSLDFRGITVHHQRDATVSPDGKQLRDESHSPLNHSRTSINSSVGPSEGEFIMPARVPTREDWVPDEKATECSCCKIVIFSMFNRRHHCRRCGRVVCGSCSAQRMRIPGYSFTHSVLVRVCNDCKRQMRAQEAQGEGEVSSTSSINEASFDCWKLMPSDETHNKILREEFCFEYAPNISLCLAILNLHSDHKIYASFLLDRCEDMLYLLTPDKNGQINPEVDHSLIIKMIRSLLVAAKFKCAELGFITGIIKCDEFLAQRELIAILVNGCNRSANASAGADCLSLILEERMDDYIKRKLRDLLIEKEQWTLALDVSTKCGLQTQGVWAAWGKACLKLGYYDSAREKFSYCLDKAIHLDDYHQQQDWILLSYSGEEENSSDARKVLRVDDYDDDDDDDDTRRIIKKAEKLIEKYLKDGSAKKRISRPSKDPALLQEILQILEESNLTDNFFQHNPLLRSKSNKGGNYHDLKLNFGLTGNVKAKLSHYGSHNRYLNSTGSKSTFNATRNFRYQESLYYLLMYGSYSSILEYFIRHGELEKCLSYILENEIEPELFFNAVILGCLRNGSMMKLFTAMKTLDKSLLVWKKYLIYTCRNLEKKQLLNTLYELQLFMNDYVRAAMTCIKFYVMDARSYADICLRNHFLLDAQRHLEAELQVENVGKSTSSARKISIGSAHSEQTTSSDGGLTLQMEASDIDKHINTISRQMEIAKFLGACEKEGRCVNEFLSKLSFMEGEGLQPRNVPTLFGNQQERTHLAVLAILCGINVEEGFGIAFRVMQDYNLRPQKVYSLVGHILACENKIHSIELLIKCCRSSGAPNSVAISDRVLAQCIKFLLERSSRVLTNTNDETNAVEIKDQIDCLIKLITDVELKIESYIESRQLKAAYLTAVKHSRAQDVRRILNEADRLGQSTISSICSKWLRQNQQLQ